MQVGILGPLQVIHDGSAVEVGGTRLRSLLARLAVDAGHEIPATTLIEDLWPGEAPGSNALHSLVSRLRRSLPEPDVVASTPLGYRLSLDGGQVDAHRFEQLCRDGRAALLAGDLTRAADLLTDAERLWRGPPLADAAGAAYAAAPAERWRLLRLAAAEDRLDAQLRLGLCTAVLPELAELVQRHPLRERLRELQIRALHASGRQSDALAAYADARAVLADELGVDPPDALRDLHLALVRGDAPTDPRAETVPATPPTNLRAALTSFVGRDADVATLLAELATHRLITLVGPGGSGKTRLACQAAASATDLGPHGIWLAELAAVSAPGDVPQAVLSACGLRESRLLESTGSTARDAMTALVEGLAPRRVLLVLDNCEHLVDGAARLADHLLGACAGLRILATSREPLGITGEVVRAVPPLGVPDPGAGVTEALASPAIRLLDDRARAARAGFHIDTDTVQAAVEICRRLDGLPLAIELAAARLRSMDPAQLAAGLDDRFRLLTGGSRTAIPRHQTLRAVVAWSWDLLEDDERRLAERLAVFAGGITLDAAAAVCDGDRRAVLDVLAALVDKSLLSVADGDTPAVLHGTRYRMLETLREYGIERLADRGELAGARAAHARYFLGVAEEADPHLRTAEQLDWLALLAAERDNLLAALRYAVDVQDVDTAMRMAAALGWWWTLLGNHTEAASWLDLALGVPGQVSPELRAVVIGLHAVNSAAAGITNEEDVDLAALRAELERVLASGIDPMSGHFLLAWLEPAAAMLDEDPERVSTLVDERMSHPDPWARGGLLLLRGALLENVGDTEQMRADLERALEIFEAIGERWGIATVTDQLSGLWLMAGDAEAALAGYRRSEQLMRELAANDDVTHQQIRAAIAQAATGDVESAQVALKGALAVSEASGAWHGEVFALLALGELNRHWGDRAAADALLSRALERYHARGGARPPQLAAMTHASLCFLALDGDDLIRARAQLAEAVRHGLAFRDGPVLARVAVAAAAVAEREGDAEHAARLLGAAWALRGGDDLSNPDSGRVRTELRDRLGAAAFDAAHESGRLLPRDAAIDLVREHGAAPADA